MAAYIDNIVDTAHYPQIIMLIAPGAVAGKINPIDLRPVLLAVTFIVAPDRPQHRGPRSLDHEVTALVCANWFSVASHDIDIDSRERFRRGARRGWSSTGNRRDHDCARLSLPPRVHDRTSLFTNQLA